MEMEYHTTSTTSITHNHRIIWISWWCWWRSVCCAEKLKIRCFMPISSSKDVKAIWNMWILCSFVYIICIHTCVKVRRGWLNKKCDLLLSYNLSASLYMTAVKHIWMDIRFHWFVMCNTVAVEYAYFIFWIWCTRTIDAYHNKECNVLIMRSILKRKEETHLACHISVIQYRMHWYFLPWKTTFVRCNCNYMYTYVIWEWYQFPPSQHGLYFYLWLSPLLLVFIL